MKKIFTYCDYCGIQTNRDGMGVPCFDCCSLLKETLKENHEYNTFRLYGSILKIPIGRGFSMAMAMGEAKYIVHFMKRLARKAAKYL